MFVRCNLTPMRLYCLHSALRNAAHGLTCRQLLSTETNSSYFVTTPIFYTNAGPHIGHLYTAVLADASARWHRLLGDRVVFSTGTDEHGLKIQQAAEKNNIPPLKFCDTVSREFKNLFQDANIQYSDYIRTTEERHRKTVECFWAELESRGYLYKGCYEGWYSVSDEKFLTNDEVKDVTDKNGVTAKVSIDSGMPVTWTKEDNHMFRLSAFTDQLTAWVDKKVIQPSCFEPMVRADLERGLPDLSVSRNRDRLSWGISVPNDDSQTIYVWLDALLNYLTVAGYPDKLTSWPPDVQVVGKDILRFHAVYWPAFLMAAGMAPPAKILCHSHWTVDGQKMSKSRGNVIDPFDRMNKYTPDGLRYFLMKDGTLHTDSDYNERRITECINSDLVNTLGNLLSRCTSDTINVEQIFPSLQEDDVQRFISTEDREMFNNLRTLPDAVAASYDDFQFYRGINSILTQLYWANGLVEKHKIWKLKKDPQMHEEFTTILHLAMETLRVCGILLQPIIPVLSDKLLTRLGVSGDDRIWNAAYRNCNTKASTKLGTNSDILLKRLSS